MGPCRGSPAVNTKRCLCMGSAASESSQGPLPEHMKLELPFGFLMLSAQSPSFLWSSMLVGGGAVRATSAACGGAAGQAHSMADRSKK